MSFEKPAPWTLVKPASGTALETSLITEKIDEAEEDEDNRQKNAGRHLQNPDNDPELLLGENVDEAELEDGDGDEDVAHNHPSVDGREVGSVGQSVARSRVQHHQNQHAHDADSGPGGGVSLVDERDDPGGDDDEDGRDVNQVRVKCQVAVQLKVHFDARERSG